MIPTGTMFERQDCVKALAGRAEVDDLYLRAYAERVATGDRFAQPDAFMQRFDAYVANPAFDMLVAVRNGRRVGQTWGWPLNAASRWWQGLIREPEPGFVVENGRRTFALSEIMVDRAQTGQGIARALHDQLLGGRTEERATLLVNPANVRARDTYIRWGWSPVAQLRPSWPGAHLLDVLIRRLPLDKSTARRAP
jgi:ribosomal protein S18 acetylase RimI-like enzyme